MPPRSFVATIKRASPDAAPPLTALPAAVQAALANPGDEAALCAALAPYLTANFIKENIADCDELLDVGPEVDAVAVELSRAWVPPGARFPQVTASARFELALREDLDEDALAAWQEEHDFLTDAVNFAWVFPDVEYDGWLTSHEGAGFGFAD